MIGVFLFSAIKEGRIIIKEEFKGILKLCC